MRTVFARIAGMCMVFVLCAVLPVFAKQQESASRFEIYAFIIGAGGVHGSQLMDAVKKVAGKEYVSREIIVNGAPEFFEIGRDSRYLGRDFIIVTGGPPFDSRISSEQRYTRVGVRYAPGAWSVERSAPVSKAEIIKNMNNFLGSLMKEMPFLWQKEFE